MLSLSPRKHLTVLVTRSRFRSSSQRRDVNAQCYKLPAWIKVTFTCPTSNITSLTPANRLTNVW